MKIRTKLFIAILSFAVLLVLSMYGVSRWKFENGFLRYVQQAQLTRLAGVVDALSNEYRQTGSWQKLVDNQSLWIELVEQNFSARNLPPPNDIGPHRFPPGFRPGLPADFMTRLILADADFKPLIDFDQLKRSLDPAKRNEEPHDEGEKFSHDLSDVNWEEVRSNDEVVGYLGLRPRRELNERLDKVFFQQQLEMFGWVAVGAFLFSLLFAQILAHGFSLPIFQLASGTKVLSGGNFKFRLRVKSKDELGQLCADFNSLAISLEKSQVERETWLATFSHELRTPIAILRGEIDAMSEGVRPINLVAINSLREEVDRVARLVEDLYELSRSSLGTLSYRKERVDLVELLEQLIETEPTTTATIQFGLLLPDVAWVWGDDVRLSQLVRNLEQNTRRYCGANSAKPGAVQISLTPVKNHWRLRWEDNGPGVPDELLSRIFEPFFRVTEQPTGSNAGLGLAICKNIVEAHQGTINAEKSSLGGLAIVIEFPLLSDD